MRHPTQAALVPPAQAEALYDIALEREFNKEDPEEKFHPAETTSLVIGTLVQGTDANGQVSEVAKLGPTHQIVLSENLALPPSVRRTIR